MFLGIKANEGKSLEIPNQEKREDETTISVVYEIGFQDLENLLAKFKMKNKEEDFTYLFSNSEKEVKVFAHDSKFHEYFDEEEDEE